MADKPRLMPAEWQHGSLFSSPYTFMGVPGTRDLSKADVAIIGMPLDLGTMIRSGARFGPRGIRNASTHLQTHAHKVEDLKEPFRSLRVIDYGDIEMPYGYIEEAVKRIEAAVAKATETDTFPLCLGGDHSISLPILRALFKKHGKLSLVHFDAHPDFWEPPEGMPYNHGTMFRMASDEGIMDPHFSVQVGIRGGASLQILNEVRAAGITVITGDEFWRVGVQETVETIKKAAGGHPVHVSFDIDSVDPAFAPGTGTPEVAGLTSREAMALVRALRDIGAVGFDIVEVAPPYDSSDITSILAANLVYEFLLTLVPRWQDQFPRLSEPNLEDTWRIQ
ncbi:MAG: agmatinase [Dehalococcoidia bacterium]